MLCKECKTGSYNCGDGLGTACGHWVSCRQFKYCDECSIELQKCKHCGKSLELEDEP